MSDAPIPGCVEIPKVGGDLEVRLPFGGSIKAVRDFTNGIPDDCALINNLIVQVQPMLGSLDCFLKVLDALGAMMSWIQDAMGPPPNPVALLEGAGDLLEKLAALAPCVAAVVAPPTGIVPTIKDILELVIKLLKCVITSVRSMLDFQAGIDLNAADGNPVLIAQLECAKANASETMAHSLASLGPLGPLLDLVAPLLEIVGLSLETPPMDEIMGMEDVSEAIEQIEAVIVQIESVVDALPV